MPPSAAKRPRSRSGGQGDREGWSRTVALVVIAAILALGASWWMSWLVVPLVFAVVLATALHPLADRLERLGLPRVASSVCCALLLAAGLLGVALLVTAQAGQVVRNTDRYLERLGVLVADASGPIRDSGLVRAVTEAAGTPEHDREDGSSRPGDDGRDGERPGDEALPFVPSERPAAPGDDDGDSTDSSASTSEFAHRSDPAGDPAGEVGPPDDWQERVLENADMIGGWVVRGVGGVIGLIGQAIVLFFLVLYILIARSVWSDRIRRAADALGMRLGRAELDAMGALIARWTWGLLALAVGQGVLIAAACAALGLPHWPLWGILTGLLVLIPFFGPLIAVILLATVAATAAQAWGPPLALVAVFGALQLIKAGLIQPRLYGRTIPFDALTVLLGVLVFGFLWGPLGFIAALPVLVLIRGFVEAIPGTEAVAALLGDES